MPDPDADLMARLRRDASSVAPSADLPAQIVARVRTRRRRRRLGVAGAGVSAVAVIGLVIGVALPSSRGHTTVQVSAPPPVPSAPVGAAVLSAPEGLAVSPDGDLLIDNQGTNQILSRGADGRLTVLAGNGHAGFSGDGGPATSAELDRPDAIAVAPDGTVYVADTGNNRIRAISPAGVITTVAGNGTGSGSVISSPIGPARHVMVADPTSVAVSSEGRLYITDGAGLQVLQGGLLRTDFPTGHLYIRGTSTAWFPSKVAVDTSGDIYVFDESPKLLVQLTVPGELPRLVPSYGLPVYASGIATGPQDAVMVADYGDFSLDRLDGGKLRTRVRFRPDSLPGLDGIFRPSAIAAAPDGTVYLATDGRNGGTNRPALVQIRPGGKPVLLNDSQVGPTPLPAAFVLHSNGIGTAHFGQSVALAEREIRAGFVGTGVPAPALSLCGDEIPVVGAELEMDRSGRFSGYEDSSPVFDFDGLHVGMTVAQAGRVLRVPLVFRGNGQTYVLRMGGVVTHVSSGGATGRIDSISAGTDAGCPQF